MSLVSPEIPVAGPKERSPLVTSGPVSDEMRQYVKRTLFLRDHRSELTNKYPDQWVALSANGTLIAASSIKGVLSKVEEKGLRKRGLAVKLMATTPRRLVL